MELRARHLSATLLLLLAPMSAGLIAGEAAAPPEELSPAAKRAVGAAEEAISKARAAYQVAAKKEQEKLLVALQREQEAQTKAGKLEAALAVKAAAEKVRNGVFQRELDERAAAGDDLLGDKQGSPGQSMAPLVGQWHMRFNTDWRRNVRIEPDGRCTVLRSNNVGEGTVYNLRWDAKAAAFVTENLGGEMFEIYRLTGDVLSCEHWCNRGKYGTDPASMTAQLERLPPGGQPAQGPPPPRR